MSSHAELPAALPLFRTAALLNAWYPSARPTCPAQVKALKEGKAVQKPIYNHVTGALDPPENIGSPTVSALQRTGQHPSPAASPRELATCSNTWHSSTHMK